MITKELLYKPKMLNRVSKGFGVLHDIYRLQHLIVTAYSFMEVKLVCLLIIIETAFSYRTLEKSVR